jgi:ComF family protein
VPRRRGAGSAQPGARATDTVVVRFLGSILQLLSPPFCAACDAPLADDGLLCAGCDAGDPFEQRDAGEGFRLITTGLHEGALAQAIRRFKYGARPDLARPIGARVARALTGAHVEGPACLVPVPLHPRRLAERGYNQSALIAGHAATVLGWSVHALALARVHDTPHQAGLDRADRLVNVAGAFVARASLPGARVVLVDDVVTTGATSLACAAALRGAGADVVAIVAVARAP